MSRKRMKDKSDFSILVKFPERLRSSALVVIRFAKTTFQAVKITEQLPEEEQKYTYILIEISSR